MVRKEREKLGISQVRRVSELLYNQEIDKQPGNIDVN